MTLVKWSEIDLKYNWAAMDMDGEIFVYVEKPAIEGGHNYWLTKKESFKLVRRASNWPEKKLFRQSLEERPKNKTHNSEKLK